MLTGSDCSRGEGGDTVVHPSGFVRRAITIQRRGRYVTEMESLGEGNRVGQWATTFDRLRYTPQRVRGYWSVSAGDICTAHKLSTAVFAARQPRVREIRS